MKRIDNCHVVITGASSGIGKELAFAVAARGGTPVMLARSRDRLFELAEEMEKQTGIVPLVHQMDVTDPTAVENTFSHIGKQVDKIDVLINNAGFGIFEYAHKTTLETMKSMFDVNVFGAVSCTQAVLGDMMTRRGGHIIFVASQAGKLATPKSSAYSATKHALLGYANSLRMEVAASGIRVSVVNPGPVRTSFFDNADRDGNYRQNVESFMLDPIKVADKTIKLIEKPKREVNLPGWMNIGTKLYQLFPGLVEKVAGKQFHRK
nr:SDR family oxidoreductase [Evansella caseinilytica]